ncbi:hypothetical protein HOP50_18g81920 [Chloropicon primus]|uniref:Uncharacterized protein n=1 Tax=Chloropicon primus TaxID=1764295 RepID=A0A5B8N1E6_9CHLO|nr:hypothetical protein A3770_18p81680 [Chloropicon primus]UPR04847.1 hypothetical protein HOP50_18g81920 [Chloropicon primus]|mmetsp:Transcript_5541/g.16829  ORF Transcript_5541/g.16829 Transcript_5541/m.16829 type:complete len:263 (+) Transcript_5541:39-827(+)|eukprot:QDZ25650.1 hypothetical protein A3770_18p81680 [Chloropicon primus]
MAFKVTFVRFTLKLANITLLLLGLSMGLYALSTYTEYKKLKGETHNVTEVFHLQQHHHDQQQHGSEYLEGMQLSSPLLSDNNNNFNWLNSTKVPVYITGLGGAGVFTIVTATTGLYATDSGGALCLNLYSFELLVMFIFQATVVGLIYSNRFHIPDDQRKSAEHSKFFRFLEKQEKISKVIAVSILCIQVVCICCACLLKRMKWKPRDEFDFDDYEASSPTNRQPLLHFADPDRSGSSSSRKKKKKKRGKSSDIRDKYYDDV